jgi:hypothetical protein
MSWTSSGSIQNISAAFVKALGEMSDVPKGREAKIATKTGGSYGYRYADLADALSMVRPVLAKNGLAATQNVTMMDDTTVLIHTTIFHESGEYIAFQPLAMPNGRTAQETGSAITYGRRYALLACLGLGAEDDDGASAAPRQKSNTQRQSTPTPPTPPTPPRPEEEEIKRALASVTSTEAGRIKKDFMSQFGRLADLSSERLTEAVQWVMLAVQASDEADREWIENAKTEEPS